MAIAFRSATQNAFVQNTSFTVAVPAGVQVGDVVVVVFGVNVANPVVTADPGMTLRSSSTATGESMWVYSRVIDGTEGSTWTFTFAHPSAPTLTTRIIQIASAYSGFTSPAWDNDQYGTGSANSVTTPGATAATAGELALAAFYNLSTASPSGVRNWGTATGMNERGDNSLSGTGTLALDDDIEASAGAVAGKTAVAGGSFTGTYIAWLGLLRNAPSQVAPPFIASATVVHAPALLGTVGVPFIASASAVFAPNVSAVAVDVPFIASASLLYALLLQGGVAAPFIASVTALFTPIVEHAEIDAPFLASVTALYPPVLAQPAVGVPFIPSNTAVYAPGQPFKHFLQVLPLESGVARYTNIGDLTEFYLSMDVLFRGNILNTPIVAFLHTHDGPGPDADGDPFPIFSNPNIDYPFRIHNLFGGILMVFDTTFAQWSVSEFSWDVGAIPDCTWTTLELHVQKTGLGPHLGEMWSFTGRRDGAAWGHNSGGSADVELAGPLAIDEFLFGCLGGGDGNQYYDNIKIGTNWGASDIFKADFESADPLASFDYTAGTLSIATRTGCEPGSKFYAQVV